MKRTLALLVVSLLFSYAGVSARTVSENAAAPADPISNIRSRYAAINKNLQRYRKVKKELSGYSAEGGTLEAYLDGKSVMKIVANHLGESGKALEEFYYWDGRLIFVFHKEFRYDSPLSGKIASTSEDRFYFDNDKLIKWIGANGKQVSSGQAEYGEKQSHYLNISAELLKLANS